MSRVAALFGVTPQDRASRVATMLESRTGASAGYWLQLLVAMAIATLGLALGSTAVVIGAMLVSPLMMPILTLGMGLATGSPLLVIRSAVRVVASVAAVVSSAAIVTLLLPIHDVTTEISSRTSPTALDLAIASCCAVAGVYAVIRPGSDTASAAAGTAIGIALVPPLCVVGYGIGTGTLSISSGAALLFTANLCAILFVSVVGFAALGYGRVSVATLERAHTEAEPAGGVTARVARRLSLFFASRLGPAVRIAMPLVLILGVFWPLRSALAEVTWEIRVRNAVSEAQKAAGELPVYSSVHIERHEVSVRLVAVGTEEDARRLREVLTARVTAAAGVAPTVEVVAVPDAQSLARTEAALRDQSRAIVPAAPVVPPHANVDLVRRDIETALAAWPEAIAGPLVAWTISWVRESDRATIDVVHLGQPLGDVATSLLARSLSNALHGNVTIRDRALSPEPVTAARPDGRAWRARATDAASVLRMLPESAKLSACIALPSGRDARAVAAEARAAPALLDPRVSFTTADDTWSLRWTTASCVAGTAADAGTTDAGTIDAAVDAGALAPP